MTQDPLATLTRALASQKTSPLIVLAGEPEAGAALVEAARRELAADGSSTNWIELDLGGYEADGALADFQRFRGVSGELPVARATCWNAARVALGAAATAEGKREDWLALLAECAAGQPLWLFVRDLPSIPSSLLISLGLAAVSEPNLVVVALCRPTELRERSLVELPAGTLWIEVESPAEIERQALFAGALDAESRSLLLGESGGVLPERAAKVLPRFLAIASLCGPAVVADLIFDVLGVWGEDREELIDFLDRSLVESGLLVDLEYSHPAFPKFGVYRFASWQAAALARQAIPPAERTRLGGEVFDHLSVLLSGSGRGGCRLLLELASWLGRAERRRLARQLAWWTAPEEAQELTALLTDGLASGRLEASELWDVIEETAPMWKGARRLALLDAYATAGGAAASREAELHSARAAALFDLGRWPEARREALIPLDSINPDLLSGYLLACCRAVAGRVELGEGKRSEARDLLSAALESATRLDRQAEPGFAPELEAMASALLAGDDKTVGVALETLIETCRQARGSSGRAAADLWTRLADLFSQLGQKPLARAAIRRSLTIARAFAAELDAQIATGLKHLAEVEAELGDEMAAARAYQEALAIEVQLFGKKAESIETLQNSLIDLYLASGDDVAARRLLTEAVEVRKLKYGPNAYAVQVLTKRLADVCRRLGDRTGAIGALNAALETERFLQGGDHPSQIVLLKQLFDLYRELGDHDSALTARRHVLTIEENQFGQEDRRLVPSLKLLAMLHQGRGDVSTASQLAARAKRIEDKSPH